MAKNGPKSGPGLIPSIVVLVLGLIIGTTGTILAFLPLTDIQSNERQEIPGAFERELDTGTYELYVESFELGEIFDDDFDDSFGETVDNGGLSNGLALASVVVLDPSGQQLAIAPSDPELVTNRGFTVFQHIGSFDATEPGVYSIEVSGTDPSTLVVGQSFETALGKAVPYGILALVGSLIVFAGVAMLAIGLVRRQRIAKAERSKASTSPPHVPPLGGPQQPPGQMSPPPPPPPSAGNGPPSF